MSDYKRGNKKDAIHFPDPIAVILPPKKSTVKLWIKSQSCFWNEAGGIENK